MGIVLDSTVLIAAERAGQNPRDAIEQLLRILGDTEAVVSVISIIELAHAIDRANSVERQIARQRFVNELVNEISIEPITIPIALRAGRIDGTLRSKGQSVSLADLLIGATALELGYSVVTHNLRHFERIPSLEVKPL